MACEACSGLVDHNLGQEELQVPRTKSLPTRETWEQHHQLIKQLYVDEKKKLNEVMQVMGQHGFQTATPKMFKDRIKKWGLDKKHKERDIIAILRKKQEREAIGKQTSFRVRGKLVTMEQIEHYLKRKPNFQPRISPLPSTPPDISYRTPSPVPHTGEEDTMDSDQEYSPESHHNSASKISAPGNFTTLGIEQVQQAATPVHKFTIDENVVQQMVEYMHYITHGSSVERPVSPPCILLVPERLLFTLRLYIQGSLENGYWVLADNGWWKSTLGTFSPSDFTLYCSQAMNLAEKGSFSGWRRLLCKAFQLIPAMLKAQSPKTLTELFDLLLYSIHRGHQDIPRILISHLKDMATISFQQPHHPLRRICQLLALLDINTIQETIFQAQECIIDNFNQNFGVLSLTTVTTRLERLYYSGSRYLQETEVQIRTLLAECEVALNLGPYVKIRVVQSLGEYLMDQERDDEAESVFSDILVEAKATGSIVDEIYILSSLAWSQFYQHKRDLAEGNMRRAIEISGSRLGKDCPEAISYLDELEDWLREWGREEDADLIHVEWENRLGADEDF